MKDNPSLLKKWLWTYVLFSILILAINYTFSKDLLDLNSIDAIQGFSLTKSLIIYLIFFAETLFFYLKVTKKTISWCLNTSILAFFISFLLALFFSTVSNYSAFISTAIFDLLSIFVNALFIFAGVYIEQNKQQAKNWDDTILDDGKV